MSTAMNNSHGWPRNSSTGPGGGLSTGPGGGLSTGPGGELTYHSNIPPRTVYLEHLRTHGYDSQYEILKMAWRL